MTEGTAVPEIIPGLKQISLSGHVAKGFNCTVKAIIKGNAIVVFLADDFDNKEAVNVITGLCKKHNVRLITGVQKETMGEAFGFISYKQNDVIKKKHNCAACAITKIGRVMTTELEEFLKTYEIKTED